jgi:hypothetical protein
MKNLLILLFCASLSIPTFAQTSDAEAAAMANLLGVQKKEAIAKLVNVSGKDSVAFWKIYDEYQKGNVAMGKDRIQLYEKTAHAYSSMTPTLADSLSQKYFQNRFDQEKELQNYYKKIKTATNAVVAFQFYQAEVYILTQIRATIMQQIPTYGEFMQLMKKY